MTSVSGDNPNPPSQIVAARPVALARMVRLWAALILVGCVAVLGTAAYLHPDARGFGTHTWLGTGPCGFLVMTGYPCPTCGMTTAFAYTVRGQWLRALWAQPTGFLLTLGVFGAALVALFALAAGRWPRWRPKAINPFRLFAALLVLFFGGWTFKVITGLVDGTLPYR